jgi:hypothetical protein
MTLQHEEPARIRATLAGFFTVGSLASLAAWRYAGELPSEQLWWGGARAVPRRRLRAGRAVVPAARPGPTADRDAVVLRRGRVSIMLRAALG